MRWIWVLFLAAGVAAQEFPKILYSKSFPGSNPPYAAVTLDQSGKAEFKDAPDDEDPIRFELEPAETAEIFALAGKLDHFRRPLETSRKVARMGMKTFRYEDGQKAHEVAFNYSEDPDARLLADWFERIVETVQHFIHLERTAKFDRLGVDGALLHLQVSLERDRLVGARLLLPVLQKIAGNHVYMNRARERAAGIAEALHARQSGAPAQ